MPSVTHTTIMAYNEHLHLSKTGADLIKEFEELRLEAYDDKRPNVKLKRGDKCIGVCTIGYGYTTYPNGKPVMPGDTITEEQADLMFPLHIIPREQMLRKKIKRDLLWHEFDAVLAFIFNAGTGYKNKEGRYQDYLLFEHINKGMHRNKLTEYWRTLAITSGGVRMRGLERRRKSEVHLFTTGVLDFFE